MPITAYPALRYSPLFTEPRKVLSADEDAILLANGQGWSANPQVLTANQLGLALAALNARSKAIIDQAQYTELIYYIEWSAGCTGGTIVVEEAHDPAYTGTWAPMKEIPWSGAARLDSFSVQGLHIAHCCRVKSPIQGGTVNIFGIWR